MGERKERAGNRRYCNVPSRLICVSCTTLQQPLSQVNMLGGIVLQTEADDRCDKLTVDCCSQLLSTQLTDIDPEGSPVPKTRSIRLNVLTEHRLVTDRHMAVASTALAYRRARKIGRWRESGEKERRAHTTAPSRLANVKLFIVFRYIFLCALVCLPYKAYPVCVTRSVLKPLRCRINYYCKLL